MALAVSDPSAPAAVDAAGQARQHNADVVTRFKERFLYGYARNEPLFKEMAEDNRMLKGDQWDVLAKKDRLGRPMYVGNRFPALLAQITGEVRRNRPGISCKQGDGAATPRTAEIFEGLIRFIERQSHANQVYARAVKHAAGPGMGHMRIVPVHPNEDDFKTELRIRSILNIYSVTRDPDAREEDKRDARWCIVTSELDERTFHESYPQAGSAAWAKAAMYGQSHTPGRKTCTIAECWEIEAAPVRLVKVASLRPWQDETGAWVKPTGRTSTLKDPDEQVLAEMAQRGIEIVQERRAEKKRILMYLIAGDEIVAGPLEWKGSRIPIFTVTGEEINDGDEIILHGIVRHSRDPQKLFNWSRSADMETVAMAPKAPIIAADEQIEDYEDDWEESTRKPKSVLKYKALPGVPPPQRPDPVGTNPGPNALAAVAQDDMKATSGIYDAAVGARSNETSGIAIDKRDAQVDTGTFVYTDNLNTQIAAIGDELVCAIPFYYSVEDQITILGPDDAPEVVRMAEEGATFDGKYLVVCKPGPSYSTRKEKAVDTLVDLFGMAHEAHKPIIFEEIAQLSEFPGGDKFVEKIRAASVAAGLTPPPPGVMPPGMPGAPPPGAPLPPPPNAAPPGPDMFEGISFSPRGAPAPAQRVADPRMRAAAPGM